jgi:hypothetical protein
VPKGCRRTALNEGTDKTGNPGSTIPHHYRIRDLPVRDGARKVDFVDADSLFFIDETGSSTKMTRRYGRARGRRLLTKAPFGHWKTTTFVAALRRGWPRRQWCSTAR